MAVEWLAGQVLTADDLMDITRRVVEQGTDQENDTTTLADSQITVPVDGLTVVELHARYQGGTSGVGGGGITWAWRTTGSVTGTRHLWSPGENTSGGIGEATTYNHRSIANLTATAVSEVDQYTTSTTNAFAERVRVEGVGDLVLQFAQKNSHAEPTTLSADTWAVYVRAAEA